MRAGFLGVLLGGQPEGVPAHRVHDAGALHAMVAADDVGGRVALGMADVQAVAAGIGKHVQDVQLAIPGQLRARKCAVFFPELLPFGFDDGRIVARHGRQLSKGGILHTKPGIDGLFRPVSRAARAWAWALFGRRRGRGGRPTRGNSAAEIRKASSGGPSDSQRSKRASTWASYCFCDEPWAKQRPPSRRTSPSNFGPTCHSSCSTVVSFSRNGRSRNRGR